MPTTKKSTTTRKKPVVRKKATRKKTTRRSAARKTQNDTFVLDSVCIINHAKALHEKLGHLSTDTDINIDASNVEMVDTAALQLLYAFTMQVRSTDHKVIWVNPSEEFVSRAAILGLDQQMGIS